MANPLINSGDAVLVVYNRFVFFCHLKIKRQLLKKLFQKGNKYINYNEALY